MKIIFITIFCFGLAKFASAQTTTYEYDKLYRLTKIIYSNGSTVAYQYDANGNRSYQFNVGAVTTFTFIGDGNWSVLSNWLNNTPPPLELPPGALIIIDPVPTGECVLDVNQKILPGANLRVATGKRFKIPGSIINH